MEPGALSELIERALAEDVGPGDLTTEATVDPDARAVATVLQKADGALYGLDAAVAVFARLDPGAEVERLAEEGVWRTAPEPVPVLRVSGRARALLTGERTALNLARGLSGVATATARVVRALEAAGAHARVLDTRKTTPGLRLLEKEAVAAAGGVNHRVGLYDAILIKENHIAAAGGITAAVTRARDLAATRERPASPMATRFSASGEWPIEVEVRDPGEIDEALAAGATALLLDNMSPHAVRAAVAQVDGRAVLEASGDITAETILVYATIEGLDYVSMGALTHSAPALDLSLALEAAP